MAYSVEVVRRARERLAQARDERERENREHLDIAYSRQPRLQEIDRLMRMTMAKAACAVFSGGDAAQLMEQAKRENLSLQQERRQIIESCFEEGFLDETGICPICSGSGYVGSNMCECLRELCRQEQKKELTFLSAGQERFEQFRLDYYSDKPDPRLGFSPRSVMERTFQNCRRYAMGFSMKAGNLLFSGNTGLVRPSFPPASPGRWRTRDSAWSMRAPDTCSIPWKRPGLREMTITAGRRRDTANATC